MKRIDTLDIIMMDIHIDMINTFEKYATNLSFANVFPKTNIIYEDFFIQNNRSFPKLYEHVPKEDKKLLLKALINVNLEHYND